MDQLRKLWAIWKNVGQAIGDLIGRLILSVFYFTLFMPFGLSVRLWGDPLALRLRDHHVIWIERNIRDLTFHDLRRLS
jgi:hypothetical protein